MIEIPLNHGEVAIIDDEDGECCSRFKWRVTRLRNGLTQYVTCFGKPVILMHRLLMNAQKGQLVDHKNGCGLDNRRENLRICSKSQNAQNSLLPRNNSTGIKGVRWFPRTGKWHAYIMLNQKQLHLGYFFDKELAQKARASAERKLFGDFSPLNCRK